MTRHATTRSVTPAVLLALAWASPSWALPPNIDIEIGTLPPGTTLTIVYRALLNDPLPGPLTEVVDQGVVKALNHPKVLTDDPNEPGSEDPTTFPVVTVPRPLINFEMRPFMSAIAVGDEIEFGVFAVSDDGVDRNINDLELVLNWDPALLRLLEQTPPTPNFWNAYGFLQGDEFALNESITPADGDALWVGISPFIANQATAAGELLVTFKFQALGPTQCTVVEMIQSDLPNEATTFVRDRSRTGNPPPQDVTGLLAPALVQIGLTGGNALVVGLEPAPGAVINTVSGVTQIVVRYDSPFTVSNITVTGVNSDEVFNGVPADNGTNTHTITFDPPLEDQDRYTVVVTENPLVAEWEFVTLIGDCDKNGQVTIFDLFRVRRALRDGTFDAFCNIDDSNDAIDIFDLFEIRKAVKEGAQAPPSP